MSERRLRAVHVVPSIAPTRGGPARCVPGLAGALCQQQVDCVLVTGRDAVQVEPEVAALPVLSGARLPLPFEIPGPALVATLNRAIHSADIVHLHSVWNGMTTVAAWIARAAHKPVVLSPHGMLSEQNVRLHGPFKRLYLALVESGNLESVAGFHFLDETERESCLWLPAARERPCIVEPNGLSMAAVDELLRLGPSGVLGATTREPGARHLVFLGRIAKVKGLELQLELLADLRAQGRPVHLHLIGPDHGEAAPLRALAASLHLGDAVHVHGPIYDDSRFLWLHEADAVVLTSYTECNPMTGIETMTAGGVLVATDTCHLDLAAAAGAVRVVPRSRARLGEALAQLLDDRALADAQRVAARRYAQEHLEWKALAVAMRTFYQTLLGPRA